MKNIVFFQWILCSGMILMLLCPTALSAADNSRSDTLNILHYDISLQLTNLVSTATLTGECGVRLVPKVDGITQVLLDLEDLDVTAVEINGLPSSYTHSGINLRINLASPANTTDTLDILVHYNGNPPTASFGGFYFTSGYAYNLGVGIGVDPPAYGRAWFPCIDNFKERSTYSFHITTQANRKAFCNGLLESTTDNVDGTKTWHWNMYQTIPTYLASVAVSQYETLEWEHAGIVDSIPVQLGVRAADTSDCRASFIHLDECISAFEQAYGPYQFDRIGFVMVPFNGGAMEHATNIAYPNFAIDGTLNWESLMSHEFSHHWFGDLVTCETASDMWLNEGWASYSAQYFLEAVYGRERYLNEVRRNHDDVLRTAHITDGSHLPVAGVPFDATYGKHVYDKGADVAHTLRGYMGDDLFFGCLQQYLNAYAFQTATTDQFRDYLSACSGIDLTYFFDDWVKQPGWAHFSLAPHLSPVEAPKNNDIEIVIRQRSYANPNAYHQVPFEITFFDEHFNRHKVNLETYNECTWTMASIPFQHTYMALDFDDKINDATTDYYHFIDTVGSYSFPTTQVAVTVDTIADTTLLRVIHNYVAPDRIGCYNSDITVDDIILSPNHYWTVEGYNQDENFHASASFSYNGSSTGTGAYLDNQLITGNEINLRLLYRPLWNEYTYWAWADNWEVVTDAVLVTGASSADKRGSFTVPNLRHGEYALGYYSTTLSDMTTTDASCISCPVGVPTISQGTLAFTVQPNPATAQFVVTLQSPAKSNTSVIIYDTTGRKVYQNNILAGNRDLSVANHSLANGMYLVYVAENNRSKGCSKLVIEH